jgi:hypothetical protein
VNDHSGQRPSIFASMMPNAMEPGVSTPAAMLEDRATDVHAPVMRVGEPDRGGLETKVRPCGRPVVSDAQLADGPEADEGPVALSPIFSEACLPPSCTTNRQAREVEGG